MPSELLFSRAGTHVWAALRENAETVELRVEDEASPARVGRVIKARVVHVVPAIQSAFVDLGHERTGFLHVSELLVPKERPSDKNAPIQDRLAVGRELVVQIGRESSSEKGDRVTCHVGLPGRLCVYFPYLDTHRVSRRIRDAGERERLTRILEDVGGGQGAFVARTAARGAADAALRTDAGRLVAEWQRIGERAEENTAPSILRDELPLSARLLRDLATDGLPERVVFDDERDRDHALSYLAQVDPDLAARIELDRRTEPLFDRSGVTRDMERSARSRVWLRSGGYIVIEQTEALVSIDVNTGRSVRRVRQEQTSRETNLEAAEEIARQLRLRDLGGIVVVDLVDTADRCRQEIVDALETALLRDPARTRIVDVSEIGLLQLTRKRSRMGPAGVTLGECAACHGSGRVRLPGTLASRAIVELRRRIASGVGESLAIRAHPGLIESLEAAMRATPLPQPVELQADASLPRRRFEIETRD